MESLISQFMAGAGSHPYHYTEAHLDAAGFKAFAAAELGKHSSRKPAEAQAAMENRNRLISSIAGVAQLESVEADYEMLNIYRDIPVVDFAETRQLGIGNIAIYRTRAVNPVGYHLGGLAGAGSTHYYATKDQAQNVQTFTIQTEEVMIPNLHVVYDMEKLQQRKHALEELANAMKMAMSNSAFNTVLGATDVVNYDPAQALLDYATAGGSFAGKTVYVLNPGVQDAFIPSVNFYDLSSEGGVTKKVWSTINSHAIKIGRSFTRAYCPSGAAPGTPTVWESLQDMATPVALITGSGLNNDPRKAIPAEMWSKFQSSDFSGEIQLDWLGLNMTLKKQNWIPSGYLILFSDQPSMLMWDRLSLSTGDSRDGVLETPAGGMYTRRSEAKQVAMIRPDFCLRNFLIIKYSTGGTVSAVTV